MSMHDLSRALRHYKRSDIQKEMIATAQDREVAVRFGKGFGKRPDVLSYPNDVLEFAKKGASSFHVSEERWSNPLRIETGMRPEELEELRIGWDLVLDIDCPVWKLSKIITYLMIRALRDHGIKSISLKFSGNKGFHIGVPFEAFPASVHGKPTRSLFPEGPKKIANYLLDYIGENLISVTDDQKIFFDRFEFTIKELMELTGKSLDELTLGRKEKKAEGIEYICERCGHTLKEEDVAEFRKCPACGFIMKRMGSARASAPNTRKFDPLSIIEVDTLLISSRHLYRMAYSLHEKSGLVSLPIDPDDLLSFRREMARPGDVEVKSIRFLDSSHSKGDEARMLIVEAFDHQAERLSRTPEEKEIKHVEFEELTQAAPEEMFPPCIKLLAKGVQDGRKRAVFILINFLTSVGWDHDKVEKYLKEWNKRNREPLREVYWRSQLRYHKQQNKKILPPNCDNQAYYIGLGVCKPDSLCKRIKNPVNYTRIRWRSFSQDTQRKKKSGDRHPSRA